MAVAARPSRSSSPATPVARRAAARSVAAARARADAEVQALVEAALVVLGRAGAAHLTVADVLAEAGLSTRAFYRHFPSKDELVLAVFEHETTRSLERLTHAVERAPTPRAALDAWIDETLALAYAPRRARRTQTLWSEGQRVRAQFPAEFDAILERVLAPLITLLARGRDDGAFPRADPEQDARSIHDVVWGIAQRHLDGERRVDLAHARAQARRFCLGALGAAE